MDLGTRPLDEGSLADAVNVLNAGFLDYIVKIDFSLPMLLRMIRHDQIDCSLSSIVKDGERDVGVALIARRGWSCRLAAMAVIPEARGHGVGSWLVDQLLRDAKERGDRAIELEVIEGNDIAVRLYESHGFEPKRQLLSFQATHPVDAREKGLREVDIRHVANQVTRHGLPDLPWQVSGESLAQVGPPSKGYQLNDAYIIVSDLESSDIKIRGLITELGSRRQGLATRLLHVVMAKNPGKTWIVPPFCPQELEPFFLKAGFARGSVSQVQMSKQLA